VIDLHVHTCFSDGEHTPEELIDIAKSEGIDVISITDHDSISGISRAILEGNKRGITVIPGIEISAFDGDNEIHVLGYNINFNSDKMVSFVKVCEEERAVFDEKVFYLINNYGYELSKGDVNKFRKGAFTTAWHFAKALCEKGNFNVLEDALKFLSEIEPRRNRISVKDSIKLIRDCGGIPVLAHPVRLRLKYNELYEQIKCWKSDGLRGIEGIYSLNSDEDSRNFLEIARELELGITIGSDYHGEHVKPAIELGRGINNNMNRYDMFDGKVKEFLGI